MLTKSSSSSCPSHGWSTRSGYGYDRELPECRDWLSQLVYGHRERVMRFRRVAAIVTLGLLFAGMPARASELLPIFDAHLHYSDHTWASLSPMAALALLDQAGVTGALVSSTPDDGTLMLQQADPRRVVPALRPYRSQADMANWYRDAEVLAYVENRIERTVYRGIGEFHLMDTRQVDTPQMKRIVDIAVDRNILLHVHSDAAPVAALFAIDPEVKILWAHAGLSAPPARIGELLDRYPQLWTEVSLRADDIAPGGRLDRAWEALLLRHVGRFMIGTDTWTASRWPLYVGLIKQHREWLRQLPPDVAEKIAHRNADRLFGRK